MGKRRNDSAQESKEAFEARSDREEAQGSNEDEGLSAGFIRASDNEIKKRRIVSVVGKWKKKSSASTYIQPPSAVALAAPAAGSSAVKSSNPFANTVLSTPGVGMSTGRKSNNDVPESKPNPFSSVSFAVTTPNPSKSKSSTISRKATPGLKFSSSSSSTLSNNTSSATTVTNNSINIPSFSLRSNINTPQKASNISPLRQGAQQNENIPLSESVKLFLGMLRMAQMEFKANPVSDYTTWMERYLEKVKRLGMSDNNHSTNSTSSNVDKIKDDKKVALAGGGFSVGNDSSKISSTSTTSSSAESGFSFGKSLSSSVATDTKSSATTKPFTGFSFKPASTTTTTAATSKTPTFNFNPSPAPTTANSTPPAVNIDNDNSNETADAIEGVQKQINEDEEELYSCRAKHRKFVDGQWKSYQAGLLRITKSKSRGTHQLVIRTESIGKVIFNIGIAKGMDFKEPKLGKINANILFVAIENENKGPESFMLVLSKACASDLYDKLKSITG